MPSYVCNVKVCWLWHSPSLLLLMFCLVPSIYTLASLETFFLSSCFTQSKFILIKWSLYARHSSIERFHACYFGICCFSADVDKLKKLVLHNPYVLTLPEVEGVKDEVIPKNVQQFWVRNSIAFSGGYEKWLLHLRFFFFFLMWPMYIFYELFCTLIYFIFGRLKHL